MHTIRNRRLRQSRVTAVFEDRALSFILRKGATLEELSERVANLGRRHNGWPLAITVKFGSAWRGQDLRLQQDNESAFSRRCSPSD